MEFTLRPATQADSAFLYDLYASTRAEELALLQLNQADEEKFLRFQFYAQEQAYINDYPGCEDQVILVDGQLAGRLLVWRSENAICLLDIALLPAFRGQGTGGQLVQRVMAEGSHAGKLVWLYVMINNWRAEKLYTRLGFTRKEEVGAFYVMDWRAPAS